MQKKEGRVKSNTPKSDKELDKQLEEEMRTKKKEEERKRKININ